MKKKLCALALCALVLCGCGAGPTATSAPSSAPQSAQEPPASSAEPTALERAQERLATLTVEEKVGQMFFARRPETGSAEDAAAWHLGGTDMEVYEIVAGNGIGSIASQVNAAYEITRNL